MKFNRLAAVALAGVVALTGLVAAPEAHAEPTAKYVAVGSDTLQDVMNALANGTNITGTWVKVQAGDASFGSYDAVGSTAIQTKSDGPRFGRPNGSGDGVKALSRSIDGVGYTSGTKGGPEKVVITGQVDIARSSSGPSKTDANGPLRYVPFGRDALAYAYTGGNAALASLTTEQLTNLFNCTATNIGGVEVVPVIPQLGSGSRKDFLARINLADNTLGACVKVGQEHDTSRLDDGSPFPKNGLTAMSAAQWVAQNTGAGVDRRGADAQIGSPVAGASPVTGTGKDMAPNKAYYDDAKWGRDIYVVVENARVTAGDAKYDANLVNLVNTLAMTASVKSSPGAVKAKYGFLPPSSKTPVRAPLA